MSKRRHARLLLPAVALLLIAPCASAHAQGIDDELTLGVGPSYTDLPTRGSEGQPGLGAAAYAEWRFDNFWGLTAGAATSYQLSVPDDSLSGVRINTLWFGGIYTLDVATFVPFATLALTSYIAEPELADAEGNPVDVGAAFGLGVDYRRYRHWSIGGLLQAHAFASDFNTYPVYLQLMLRLNYHFTLY